MLGYHFSQARNALGLIDHVNYFGGATYSTMVDDADDLYTRPFGGYSGVSLGNNINIRRQYDVPFDVPKDPLLMHEYGHTFDSQLFGLFYLPGVGVPSAAYANWTKIRANRHAKRYFGAKYGVNWDIYEEEWPTH